MSTQSLQRFPTLTVDLVELLLDEFEEAWKSGHAPSIEDYLDRGVAPERRAQFIRELVILDITYRRRQKQEALLGDYQRLTEIAMLATHERLEMEKAINRSATEVSAMPTEVLGKYKIVRHLVHGGQASAYLAFHPGLDRKVVVKIGKHALNMNPQESNRLCEEGRILANIQHENLVHVHDFEIRDQIPYLVLEHIEGQTLSSIRTPVAPDEAIRIAHGISNGLGAAHALGVIHRDVNPNNVILDTTRTPRVIDFGLADRRGWLDSKETPQPGGTLGYLSPEQALAVVGRGPTPAASAATDVFGVGGILYYLLTGQPLYSADVQNVMLAKAQKRAIDLTGLEMPGITPAIKEICLKALAIDPAQRYASGSELAEALSQLMPKPVTPPKPVEQQKPVNQIRRIAGYVSLAFLIGLIVTLTQYTLRDRPQAGHPSLQVRLSRTGQADQLVSKVLPVQAGDTVQLKVNIPQGLYVGLYLVNGNGELQHVTDYAAGDKNREEVYPGPGKTSELTGPAGTEFLFTCGRTDRLPSLEEVRQAWSVEKDWVALPSSLALLVKPEGAEWEGERPRDLGTVHIQQQPAEIVRRRIEAFRNQLQQAGVSSVSGVAFSHQ